MVEYPQTPASRQDSSNHGVQVGVVPIANIVSNVVACGIAEQLFRRSDRLQIQLHLDWCRLQYSLRRLPSRGVMWVWTERGQEWEVLAHALSGDSESWRRRLGVWVWISECVRM